MRRVLFVGDEEELKTNDKHMTVSLVQFPDHSQARAETKTTTTSELDGADDAGDDAEENPRWSPAQFFSNEELGSLKPDGTLAEEVAEVCERFEEQLSVLIQDTRHLLCWSPAAAYVHPLVMSSSARDVPSRADRGALSARMSVALASTGVDSWR